MTKLSRSKLELFIGCPRCFWLDLNKGVKRPPPAPYTINNAIDFLLKREFDKHREEGTAHRLIKQYKIDAIPYNCPEIDKWRHNFTGVQHEHKKTGFLVYGAVDDVWINSGGELIVVDYKATGAKEAKIYDAYKRQMEIYQWLLRQNNRKLSKRGYFLFAKANKENGFAEAKLSFDLSLEPLDGDCSWVESAIVSAKKTLDGKIPPLNEDCGYCRFIADGGSKS